MRSIRGVIALILAVVLGIIASMVVLKNLNKPVAIKKTAVKKAVVKKQQPYTMQIPKGFRAISIQVDNTSGLSKKLKKNDIVDVIVTSNDPDEKYARLSRIILQKVKILSAYPETSDSKKTGTFVKSWNVALIVTPEQGVALRSAAASGDISLLAVNPGDNKVVANYDAGYSHSSGTKMLKPLSDMTNKIPAGMRAITLMIKESDGICGVFKQGDRVDLIGISKIGGFTGNTDTPGSEGVATAFHHSSKTLLQNIEVLSSEIIFDNIPAVAEGVNRVTLLVKPKQAEIIAAVSDTSKKTLFRLVSRNPDDHKIAETKGAYTIKLLAHKKEYHRVTIYRESLSSNKIFYKQE